MLEFLSYFFGESESVEFTNFTVAHFMPIIIAAVIIFLIYHFRENIRNMKNEKIFRYIIAFTLIISEMAYNWRLIAVPSLGPNPVDHLPITVCGWVAVFGSYIVIVNSILFKLLPSSRMLKTFVCTSLGLRRCVYGCFFRSCLV